MPARTLLATAALVTAGTAGASAQGPAPTDAPTPAAPAVRAAVTLNVSSSVLRLRSARPRRLTLRGALTAPAPVRRVRLRVTGRSSAYGRETLARTVRTDRTGRYALTIRPRVNARYRVRILPGQGLRGSSVRREVGVFPSVRLTGEPVRRALRLTAVATAPGAVTFAEGPARPIRAGAARNAFFYLRLGEERRYRRVGTGRLSGVTCGRACVRTATLVVRSPEVLRRTREAGVCFREAVFRGLGDGTPCGAPRRRF